VDRKDAVIRMKTVGNSRTVFGGIFGVETMPIAGDSVARGGGNDLEIALVLDNSGSMAEGGRMDALKAASKELVDILMLDPALKNHVQIAIVPFATSVNVDPANRNAAWMDKAAASATHVENFAADAATKNRFSLFSQMNVNWGGCVEARTHGLDTTDTAPNPSDARTLFVPMFAPDEPDGQVSYGGRLYDKYPNSYLSDVGVGGNCTTAQKNATDEASRQNRTCKYKGAVPKVTAHPLAPTNYGPNYSCDTVPIMPLTKKHATITAKLDGMQPHGSTNIFEGAMWGWRVLSNGAPFTEGVPANTPKTRKVVIVMTDGDHQWVTADPFLGQNMSTYHPYGYSVKARLRAATREGELLNQALDEKLRQACVNIKAEKNGIGMPLYDIYTITLAPQTQAGRALMASCASSPKMAFAPTTPGELTPTFKEIAQDIRRIRLAE
jgi:hypothetical protein